MNAATLVQTEGARLAMRWRITPIRLTCILVLLALAVRVVGIGDRPLWLDEAYSAWFSSRGWHELWALVPTYEPHPPFYYSLLKLWRELFGGTAVALRASSIILAVFTIPVVIAASFELERQRPTGRPLLRAGVAAFLMACSPFLIVLGQEARPYPLLILAYAISVLAVLRLTREFRQADGAGSRASWLLLAAGTEVGLWAHALGAIYALCLAVAILPAGAVGSMPRARLVRGLAAVAAVAALYVPCLLMMFGRTGDWGAGWLSWQPIMLLQLFTLNSVPAEMLTIASAVAALTMLLLVKRAFDGALATRVWDSEKALLVLWWGPTLVAVLISMIAIPIFLPRTLAGTLVPAYLAMAGALARSDKPRERSLLGAALVLTLLPTAVQVALRPATEEWREVGSYLTRNVRPGDQVWLYPNDSALPLREAAPQALTQARGIPGVYPATTFKGPVRAGSPAVVSVTPNQAQALATDPAVRGVPTIWLVTRQSALFDPAGDLTNALARVRTPGPVAEWGYISVRPYRL